MRINKYVAQASGLSRRWADAAIAQGRVLVNNTVPTAGHDTQPADVVTLDGKQLHLNATPQTIIFHKPAGYVVSRDGQGSRTIYDILPPVLSHLKPVGRLDKDSSGLLLLTTDGILANQLTHPRYAKAKKYEVKLNTPLSVAHQQQITGEGVQLTDGLSRFDLQPLGSDRLTWIITMKEGRNRQIRRTFTMLGYSVQTLHRTHFGPYSIDGILPGAHKDVQPTKE